MKNALDGRYASNLNVQKVLNKTNSKLRRKLNLTVEILPIFILMKNQVYITFRKNSFVVLDINLVKII